VQGGGEHPKNAKTKEIQVQIGKKEIESSLTISKKKERKLKQCEERKTSS
jgi:hypothetical protein